MPVRAVRPRLPALHGHTYVHAHDCPGDCCNYDAFTDALATSEDIYISDVELPSGRGLQRFAHLVPGELRTANPNVESRSRVHASSPTEAGRDGRGSAPSPSPSVGARGGAGEPPDQHGSGLGGSTPGRAGSEPSPPTGVRAVRGPLDDVEPLRPGRRSGS